MKDRFGIVSSRRASSLDRGAGAYLADGKFRKGDVRFAGRREYRSTRELAKGCMRSVRSISRQVTKIDPGVRHEKKSALQWMIERLDTYRGRYRHSRRMGPRRRYSQRSADS